MRAQQSGDGVATLIDYFEPLIAPFTCDRPLTEDIETILDHFDRPEFNALLG